MDTHHIAIFHIDILNQCIDFFSLKETIYDESNLCN